MFTRLIAAALAVVSGPALAAPVATIETEIVRGDFHFEHERVAPGDQTVLALAMTMAPGWHTYWKNAGDSGQPVEIRWDTPEGVEIGDMQWPVPHRQPFEPMMNYGYEDNSTILMPVSVPASWPAGEPVTLTADVFWLVCKEVCIPEQGIAELSLPTGPDTIPVADNAVFADARASFPVPSPYEAAYSVDDASVTVRVRGDAFGDGAIEDVYFFPAEWGVIDHAGQQVVAVDGEGLTLTIPRSPETDEPPAGSVDGILKIVEQAGNGDATLALAVSAAPGDVASAMPPALVGSGNGSAGGIGFGLALGLAFLGGMILNLMPCVFPVLALKALGFAKMSDSEFGHRAAHGLAYTAGVVALFAALAALFLGLRAAGASIGWGFQLQNAYVVAGLAYLLFLIGLNLSGVFEVSSRFAGVGASKAEQGGHRGAFFTGALTAIVATPCTAPFMGTAMGASLTMPPLQAFAVFLALALGLAAPFLLLSMSPAAARLMPKPGVWMERLKQFLAFPMYATAALLVWVLGTLAGTDAMLVAMIGGVFIGLAAWAWGTAQGSGERGRRLATGTAAVAAAVAIAMVALINPATESTANHTGPGEPFSTARLSELRAEGKPVFINMTADWCITCKVNERVALSSDAFEQALEDEGITYLLGDWTARNAEITGILEGFGRAGVPLYAVYPRQGEPMLLPQILTTDMLVEALGKV